jgi:hypothetical protein
VKGKKRERKENGIGREEGFRDGFRPGRQEFKKKIGSLERGGERKNRQFRRKTLGWD